MKERTIIIAKLIANDNDNNRNNITGSNIVTMLLTITQ